MPVAHLNDNTNYYSATSTAGDFNIRLPLDLISAVEYFNTQRMNTLENCPGVIERPYPMVSEPTRDCVPWPSNRGYDHCEHLDHCLADCC